MFFRVFFSVFSCFVASMLDNVGAKLVHSWCKVGAFWVQSWCILGAKLVWWLAHSWCKVGAFLVQSWCILGAKLVGAFFAKLVHSWCKFLVQSWCIKPGCRVFTRISPYNFTKKGIKLCTKNVPTLHQECTNFAPRTKNAPTLHQECTNFAPRMHQLHQECTNFAPRIRQLCTKNAPRMHQLCANIVQHGSNKAWKHRKTRKNRLRGQKLLNLVNPQFTSQVIYYIESHWVNSKSIGFSKLDRDLGQRRGIQTQNAHTQNAHKRSGLLPPADSTTFAEQRFTHAKRTHAKCTQAFRFTPAC